MHNPIGHEVVGEPNGGISIGITKLKELYLIVIIYQIVMQIVLMYLVIKKG
jgi:hypothetical protein